MPSWLLFVSHSAELSHKLDLQANVTLKMHIFPLKNKLMIIMYVSLNKARGNAYAAIIYLHLLLWISWDHRHLSIIYITVGISSPLWTRVKELEDVLFEWHNSSNAPRRRGTGELCSFQKNHLSSSCFFLFAWPTLLCLFIYLFFGAFFFFCSSVLKGDESILCFSVWEKFQQQTFLQPSLFMGAKRSSAIFAAGETRRGKWKRELAQCFGCWWRKGRC